MRDGPTEENCNASVRWRGNGTLGPPDPLTCGCEAPQQLARKLAQRLLARSPLRLLPLLAAITASLAGVRLTRLSEQEFLDLEIEPEGSFNWEWRKPHLYILTDSGRLRRVGDIVDHLRRNLPELMAQVQETDMTAPFQDPIEYNRQFWQGGNNYLIYCAVFRFRKGVVPYKNANDYIRADHQPMLYGQAYYSSLPEMSDSEIQKLLEAHVIEISNNAVASGKHRVCAMIGRLPKGDSYVPFKAIATG
jgi:hypothetical protein